jgi:hypothetical protein
MWQGYGLIAFLFLGLIDSGLLVDGFNGRLTCGSFALGLWLNTIGIAWAIIFKAVSLHAPHLMLILVGIPLWRYLHR